MILARACPIFYAYAMPTTPDGTYYDLYESCESHGDPALPVVVLVHGVGLNRAMWADWCGALGGAYSVLTYDLLGHGQSADPAGRRTMADFVQQFIALIDHLALRRVALIGFSLGAVISRAVAAQHATRLTHLGLLHSVYRRTPVQQQAVRQRYRIACEFGAAATVDTALARWFSDSYRQQQAEVVARLRASFAQPEVGYRKAYAFFSDVDDSEVDDSETDAALRAAPCPIALPTLVITGAADNGSTPAMATALARDLGPATLIINPHHRHLAPVEHAPILINQVLSFLTE